MPKEYVEQRNRGYYVEGTRVSLDSVVYAFLRGESPDGIAESFPALSLEQIYGAIAFYLAHRARIDRYLQEGKAEFARLRDEGLTMLMVEHELAAVDRCCDSVIVMAAGRVLAEGPMQEIRANKEVVDAYLLG